MVEEVPLKSSPSRPIRFSLWWGQQMRVWLTLVTHSFTPEPVFRTLTVPWAILSRGRSTDLELGGAAQHSSAPLRLGDCEHTLGLPGSLGLILKWPYQQYLCHSFAVLVTQGNIYKVPRTMPGLYLTK